jgi:hypothetical protein
MFSGGNSVRNAGSGSMVSADIVAALATPVIPAVGFYPGNEAVNPPTIS